MKILIISDIFGKYASANGACSYEIANELKNRGHEIHILQEKFSCNECKEENIDGFIVHRIPGNLHLKLVTACAENGGTIKGRIYYILFRLLAVRTLILLPWFPMRSPFQCLKYTSSAEKLHKRINFDLTICCYYPLATLYAGERLKKKYNVNFVSYFVDTLTDNLKHQYFLSKKFMDNQGLKYEKRFFKVSDLILNLKCHEENFKQKKYDPFRNKMKITDIPHLKNRIYDNKPSQSDFINLIYTGSIRPSCLPGMIDVLKRVSLFKVKIHFYSKNCVVLPNADFLVKHGQVKHKTALKEQENADALVSIGNQGSTFIPSKIFEYISTGKPIIHFYYDNDDSCLYYYRKYRNCCLINLNVDPQKNAEMIKSFLNQSMSKIEWSELEKLFPMNKAEYTTELILNSLNGYMM